MGWVQEVVQVPVRHAANAIVFGCLAIGSLLIGAVANRISPIYTLPVSIVSSKFNKELTPSDWDPELYTLCCRPVLTTYT